MVLVARLQQVMRLAQLLVVLLIVYSYQFSAVSGSYDTYSGNAIQTREQSSSNSSLLLPKDGRKSAVYHYAIYESNTVDESVLFGGMATFDVYGFPTLKSRGVISSSVLWVVNQRGTEYSRTNAVVAGWTVNPLEYGDSKTHFFTLWTADGYHSVGCYNLKCKGFVPVQNAPITPGDTLDRTDGQLKITIKIFKNKDDGHWWLYFAYGNQNLGRVGYWPKNIFNNLDNANSVQWGGFTASYPGSPSPAMGNGRWPGNSASVRDVRYVDNSGRGYAIDQWPGGLRAVVSHKKCYGVGLFQAKDEMFYYGGPGGCTN